MSEIRVDNITDEAGTGRPDFSNGIKTSNINGGQVGGRRNLIINGDMQVAQRGTSFTDSSESFTYKLDRFIGYNNSGTVTWSQSSDAPSGFNKSFLATVDTSASADQQYFATTFEGQNMAHLEFGSSSGSDITLSFWVKASISGTYCIALRTLSANGYTFVKEYSINSTNTWEYKTITIPHTADGSWSSDNSNWGYLFFNFGAKSAYQDGVDGQWVNSDERTTSNQTQLIETTGATFQITGVQLEVGDTATEFEHRSYGEELALCQRYYWNTEKNTLGPAFQKNSSQIIGTIQFPQPMRTSPSTNSTALIRIDSGQHLQTNAPSSTFLLEQASLTRMAYKCSGFSSLSSGSGFEAGIDSGGEPIEFDAEL